MNRLIRAVCSSACWGIVCAVFISGWVLPETVTAGELERSAIENYIRPPLQVGARLTDPPVWPIFHELRPDDGIVGYAFESVDLAPVPGFEGTPINLLVAVDSEGTFVDVEVISQHEPVFLGGLGETPLREFVAQYTGLSLRQSITVASAYGGEKNSASDDFAVVDGVTKATASVRIVNRTLLSAALVVARTHLGFGGAKDGSSIAKARTDIVRRLTLDQLFDKGYVGRIKADNATVEALFANTDAAEIDTYALEHPQETFIELTVAYLNAPTIGRSLLGDDGFERAVNGAPEGTHLFWIGSTGRYAIVEDDFVPGTSPPRLRLTQGGLPLELRDADVDIQSPIPVNAARVFAVSDVTGLDPAKPVRIELTVTRERGQILPQVTNRVLALEYSPPVALFEYPPEPLPDWLLAWLGRWPDLVVLGVLLLTLVAILSWQPVFAPNPKRLRRVRLTYLVFTLCFIGWYAQGQLSIVHLTGAIKALRDGQGLSSYLYDPVALVLIAFTLPTFFVWGRGTFCGWLCPFGALQEFVDLAARKLRAPRLRVSKGWDRLLAGIPFAVLCVLILAAAFAPDKAARLVEIEPFKTAITLGFDRSWPFVAYALALLTAGAFIYKFFCRYLCPLGAFMKVSGKLRRFDWLARRVECGRPCQTCRYRCQYDAIASDGAIKYDDCFQCLDCVAINNDDQSCAADLLLTRKGRTMRSRSAPITVTPPKTDSGKVAGSPSGTTAY